MTSSVSHASLMNFRDLGGAPTAHGALAHGRLFRTGHLSGIDDAAAEHLGRVLGIGVYVDFRTDAEIRRDGEPPHLSRRGVRWHRHPFDIADQTFWRVKAPQSHDWQALYFRALKRFGPELSSAIAVIAAQETPVVFGCFAGKDRTGIVAGLILALLGVDDEWIAQDFAKTADLLRPHRARFAFLWQDDPSAELEIARAHLSTDPRTMKGLLQAVRVQFGSLENALQLPPGLVAQLRARFVGA